MPTISAENYLKAIYHLQLGCDGQVGTKAIADRLDVSLASVTRMLKSLATRDLVEYVAYRGARLTELGERQALRTIRNHRLVELFLIRTLNFTWDEVHREAEALEHALSDTVADRIDAFLGHPKFDPHGDPIPDANGAIQHVDHPTLAQMPYGVPLTLSRVLDQRPEVLRYLADNQIRPGSHVEIVDAAPFEGPLTVKVGGTTVALSRSLAGQILVKDNP